MTPFTAFVAVDSEVTKDPPEKQIRVSVAVHAKGLDGESLEGYYEKRDGD
jgi:hypothetical protein